MMEREINLLPPTIIAARSLRIYLGRLGSLMRFIVFLAVVVLAATGLTYLVVWRTQHLVDSNIEAKNEHQEAIVAQVQKVNAQLAALEAWQKEHTVWTPYLPEILRSLPDGIGLSYIGVDSKKQSLELRGSFKRREDLVALQRRLEKLSWVERVESPLSNFQTGSDARFILLVWRKGQL